MDYYDAHIRGLPPGMLQHSIDGGFVDSPALREQQRLNSLSPKAKKEPANVELQRRLEWELGLYKDHEGNIALPAKVIRATIHGAAKLTRDGQRVNRGLQVREVQFSHCFGDTPIAELADDPRARFESVVAVQKNRVLRVRPLFPQWEARFVAVCQEDLINSADLAEWLRTAGSIIGVGDWRPDKGGEFGQFELAELAKRK